MSKGSKDGHNCDQELSDLRTVLSKAAGHSDFVHCVKSHVEHWQFHCSTQTTLIQEKETLKNV